MSFQDIKGQEKTIHILKEGMRNNRLNGSCLFIGPEGIGKKALAIKLAKALNCQSNSFDPCEACVSCRKIEKNEHPDVHILDSQGGEIKIESIRELQGEINLKPYEGKKKVFIIDNAHKLNPESSNAFLKTLEEPAGESLIILVSSKPGLIFRTVVSRCQVFRFYPLKRDALRQILKSDYGLEEALAHFLAYFSEGSIGAALKMKDSDILLEKNIVVDEMTVNPKHNPEGLAKLGREGVGNRLNILASWFRDIYLIKTGLPFGELINLDRQDELLKQMNRYSFLNLDEILNSIANSLFYLERNINIRLLLANLRMTIWKG